MTDQEGIARLRKILQRRLQSIEDLRDAALGCRELVLSDFDGAGVFLFLAYYFEDLLRKREGMAVDADEYEAMIIESIFQINSCLDAMEAFDPPLVMARLDSLARIVNRKPLP